MYQLAANQGLTKKSGLTVMYIKGQTAWQANVNICKFTFCPVFHYSLFTQSIGPPLRQKATFHIYSWNVNENYDTTGIDTLQYIYIAN